MDEALTKLFDLTGRVALVTGGAGLLGEQFSFTLARAGAVVVIADINGKDAEQLADRIRAEGMQALPYQVDITSQLQVERMVEKVVQTYQRLDILINNAALDPKFDGKEKENVDSGAFETFPLSAWQQALDVNLNGAFLCCQAAVKPMLKQGKGVIINIASIYGVVAPDQRLYETEESLQDASKRRYKPVYYSVTKAGILGLTRYLAAYYGEKNIRVNSLTPGGVYHQHDETFLKAYAARAVLGRMAQKDELNGALLFLASDASSYMTGANLVVDGGWTIW